ncbi:MAG TPA: hypothetical protein ENI08_02265 [Candidatus Dependentiae bacterium]|nr:hypothetical protein [Candidatus Dependentiae bacterium]
MCELVISGYDTANKPTYKINCSCKTTHCMEITVLQEGIKELYGIDLEDAIMDKKIDKFIKKVNH